MTKEIMSKEEFIDRMSKLSRLQRDEHKKIKDLLKEYELNRQQSVDGLREDEKKY